MALLDWKFTGFAVDVREHLAESRLVGAVINTSISIKKLNVGELMERLNKEGGEKKDRSSVPVITFAAKK